MNKGKKYSYMKNHKQVNVYLSNEMWRDIESVLDRDFYESRNQFMKRAIISEIMKRRKEREKGK